MASVNSVYGFNFRIQTKFLENDESDDYDNRPFVKSFELMSQEKIKDCIDSNINVNNEIISITGSDYDNECTVFQAGFLLGRKYQGFYSDYTLNFENLQSFPHFNVDKVNELLTDLLKENGVNVNLSDIELKVNNLSIHCFD